MWTNDEYVSVVRWEYVGGLGVGTLFPIYLLGNKSSS